MWSSLLKKMQKKQKQKQKQKKIEWKFLKEIPLNLYSV